MYYPQSETPRLSGYAWSTDYLVEYMSRPTVVGSLFTRFDREDYNLDHTRPDVHQLAWELARITTAERRKEVSTDIIKHQREPYLGVVVLAQWQARPVEALAGFSMTLLVLFSPVGFAYYEEMDQDDRLRDMCNRTAQYMQQYMSYVIAEGPKPALWSGERTIDPRGPEMRKFWGVDLRSRTGLLDLPAGMAMRTYRKMTAPSTRNAGIMALILAVITAIGYRVALWMAFIPGLLLIVFVVLCVWAQITLILSYLEGRYWRRTRRRMFEQMTDEQRESIQHFLIQQYYSLISVQFTVKPNTRPWLLLICTREALRVAFDETERWRSTMEKIAPKGFDTLARELCYEQGY